jgi:lambda family phage minor tail protein L
MAYTAWAASTAFAVGDVRRATASQNSGLVFECTTAGTSGSSEPTWPTDIGSTLTDNTVVWTAISSIYADLSALAPSAIIELFELHYDNTLHGSTDILRWHSGVNEGVTGNITWDSNDYLRLPVVAEGFEQTTNGTLPRPTLSVANLDGAITALLLGVNLTTPGNDLTGAKVKRIRTLKKFLDGESAADPYATFPVEEWYVDRKVTESRDIVSFELASKFDLQGKELPNRQVVANICQWQYRSSECSYTGSSYFDVNNNSVSTLAQDACGKRLDSCKKRFGENNELPFGSFPGAGLTR